MFSRFAVYGVSSTTLAATVVANALHSRANFYAAAVGIGKSSGALMVLANFALFNAILVGIVVKSIFFGRLRPTEHEHLYERLWFFLTESLLALTIFRDDFDAPFVLTYGLLLFLKCFHWITADRVEYIPPPGPPVLFHVRVVSITSLLCLTDLLLVAYSLDSILDVGVSGMVLFAAEFMILLASITSTFAKYVVSVMDLRRARGQEDAPPWEEKSMYIFYIDLATDFAKLATYITFFTVILLHYGLPLHILRDVYFTLRSFIRRCGDLIRYRRATRDMDVLYPDATRADLDRNGDQTCIICREEMVPRDPVPASQAAPVPAEVRAGPNETPKKLRCGHVFHFHCLRAWLERQQSCPTCRHPVLRSAPARPTTGVPPVPTPAPAPAPGGRPEQPAPAGAQPTPPPAPAPRPANNGPNPIADPFHQFQQYFHLPDASQAPSVPAAAPSAPTGGIWGGPIIPGRFGGAAGEPPRVLGHGGRDTRRPGASSSAATPPVEGTENRSVGATPPIITTTSMLPPTPNVGDAPRSPILSGASTPFSSNPPSVFSSTSQVRPATASSINSETPAQRAAAAALRRLTPSQSQTNHDGTSNSTAMLPEQALPPRSSSIEAPSGQPEPTVSRPDMPVESPSTIRPHLIPLYSRDALVTPLPPPHPTHHSTTSVTPLPPPPSIPDNLSSADLELLSQQTTQGLEERIRLVHQLDDILYNMLGELTRIRSVWPGSQTLGAAEQGNDQSSETPLREADPDNGQTNEPGTKPIGNIPRQSETSDEESELGYLNVQSQ